MQRETGLSGVHVSLEHDQMLESKINSNIKNVSLQWYTIGSGET